MSSNCLDNRKNCGTSVASACVPYTGSTLTSFDESNLPCNPNINDVIKEIDILIKDIKTEISVSAVDLQCLENCNCSVNKVDELFNLLITKICELTTRVQTLETTIENIGSTTFAVNLGCFNNPCFNSSNTEHSLIEIINLLVSEVCQLKNK